MLKNPVQLRLAKLPEWQQRLFMVLLCERMYPNIQLYCQQTGSDCDNRYRKILDLAWESLLVKEVKINFDLQIEKLEEIIPTVTEDSSYIIYPAIDACEALGEILHSYLSNDISEYSARVSSISATTVAEFIMTKMDKLLPLEEQLQLTEVVEEFDLQWEILRILKSEADNPIDLIKGLKEDLRENRISNIGVFLSN
ncbi:DUF416 family protein [Orbaceae bacterium ESL0721]|nr:DUF416 family protein [Orbaceae bacterium ESL0721]